MFNFTCQFNPVEHWLIEPEILRWCRRQVDEKDHKVRLFAYFHRVHQTYVIAWWVDRPCGKFVDMLNLGFTLGNFTREKAQEFVRHLRQPTTASDIDKQVRRVESDQLHKRQNDASAESEELAQKYGWSVN